MQAVDMCSEEEPRHTIAMDRAASSHEPHLVRASYANVGDVLADARAIDRALEWLSTSERARYARYRHDVDRQMFLLGRLMARTLVGRALGVDPTAWVWREGARGRPEIGATSSSIGFNLAHSAGLVVCAVSERGPVGVDVEHRHRRPIDARLIRRYCAPAEVADIESREPARQQDSFLRYWTLKEAYLKARGLGIAVHLADISFSLRPEICVAFRDSLAGTDTGWAFHLADLDGSHFVAVAAPVAGAPSPTFSVEPFDAALLPR